MSPAIFDDIPVSVEILLIDAIIGAGLGSYSFANKAVRTGVAIESEGSIKLPIKVTDGECGEQVVFETLRDSDGEVIARTTTSTTRRRP